MSRTKQRFFATDAPDQGQRACLTIGQPPLLALLLTKMGPMFLVALLVFLQTVPAHAWRVYNETEYPIRARINSGLGNTSCGDWDAASGFEIGPGGDAGPNWTTSDCNPSGLQDQPFVMQVFVCDPNFCPGDILFDSTDPLPAEGQMQAYLSMRAGGAMFVRAQDRLYMGLPPNLFAFTLYLGEFESSSDYFIRNQFGFALPMQPEYRDVRFLVTGDPQFSFNELEPGANQYATGTQDAYRVLGRMSELIANEPQVRGMVITGDLTQNARGAVSFLCPSDPSEMVPLIQAAGLAPFVYEGLGNHDIQGSGACSTPSVIHNFVATKTRNSNKTDKLGPHYSWDWHDVHFVQANLFPGDGPAPQFPGLDPSAALTFLAADLAQNVGTTGRPVVLFHHYGFEPFSIGTSDHMQEWWTDAQRTDYWDVLRDYNVVAIFTGHLHLTTGNPNYWKQDFDKPAGALARPDGKAALPAFIAAAARGDHIIENDGVFLDVRMTSSGEMVIERKDENGNVVGTAPTIAFSSTTFDPISVDVGVIPDVSGDCPMGSKLVIYQDNEDDNGNGNARAGWNGAIVSTDNTLWTFCRVDGRLFGKLPVPALPLSATANDYAVLKLGAECPAGSTEAIRYFDDEDDNNDNSITGFAGPNSSTVDGTRMHLCHFRPQNQDGWRMPAFPSLPYEYGVFGQSPVNTDSGYVITDDEDDNNQNTLVTQFDFRHVFEYVVDTQAFLIKTAVFAGPANDNFDSAIAIGVGTYQGTLFGATVDGSDGNNAYSPQPDVWYTYGATASGVLRLNTCGSFELSGLNTTLAVHVDTGVTGTLANALTWNNDSPSGGGNVACPVTFNSYVALPVTAGDALLIRVSRSDSSTNGAFVLNASFESNPVVNNSSDTGAGSLRQVIDSAFAGASIQIDPSLSGQTITLTSGELQIDKDLTIDASTLADGLTINSSSGTRILTITNGANVSLSGFTITGGQGFELGGGIYNDASTLTLTDSTVSGNTADSKGGGIYNFFGDVTLRRVTLSDNIAFRGGAMWSQGGTFRLENTTVSGNEASYNAGVANENGTATVIHSTFSGNVAVFEGGGFSHLQFGDATLVFENSVSAGNTAPDGADIYLNSGTFTPTGANFIGDNSTVESQFPAGALAGTAANPLDPTLGPLQDNGGPTLTRLPNFGSPLIDAAIAIPGFDIDQRGAPRPVGFQADIGAVEVSASYGVVTSIAGDSSNGSLRQILNDAPDGFTVNFAPALDGQTILLTSQLDITRNVSVDASSLPNGLTLDGGGTTRVVHIAAGVDASIKGLTITGGNAVGNGGGVYNQGGTLSLVDVGLSDNHSSSYGGGLLNLGGTVTLERCTLSGNTATSSGGALYNGNDAASDMTVINSTIFGNSSLEFGGALRNFAGQVNLIHTTIVGNNAVDAGGVSIGGGSLRVENSVIAGNNSDGASVDVRSNVAITTVGENFIGDNSTVSAWLPEGPFVGTSANPKDPLLLALADNGGPTDTMLPDFVSPLIDAAITTPGLTTDQRGEPRPSGPQSDMGAVEVSATYGMVTSTAADSSDGSLRQILNAAPDGFTVNFAPALDGQTILLTSQLDVTRNVSIDASSLPNGLTLDGGGTTRVVHIAAGVDASIKGLTITGGNAIGNGGGVYNQGGTLSLVDVGLVANHASTYGGGLLNLGGSVTLERCTLSGNTANSSGGALYNGNDAASDMTVINSTIFGNSSLEFGGALRNFAGQVNLIHTTIVGNNAVDAGGVSIGGGSLRVENSVIAGNNSDGASVDVRSNVAITTVGENFIGDNSTVSAWLPEGPFVGTSANPKDPLLLALADNGGPTDTMLPDFVSPLIDAAITTPGLTTDQRGEPRPSGPQSDMGAVEVSATYGMVTSTAADSSDGSLRQILNAAPDGFTVNFAPALDGQTILLTSQLDVTRNVSIDASSLPNGLTLDGGGTTRVVHIAAGVDASIKGLTITGGNAIGNGGGVYNQGGTLSLVDVGLVANHASTYGGGLLNLGGSVTLERCTLSGNTANSSGGALYNGNDAASDMTVINSTIFGNSSLEFGGALRNFAGQVNLIHTTIVGNNAVDAGGVSIAGGTFRLENSVIAGNNSDGASVDVRSNVAITTVGENFIGDNSTVSAWLPEGPFVGTSANPKDPLLLALADNGGPTDTMLPDFVSPLIDAAITTPGLLTDQRGEPRPGGPQSDMGAVEVSATYGMVTSTAADSSDGSLRQILNDAPDGFSVNFAPALDGQTILLTSQLDITRNVSIDASSLPNGLTLDGGGTTRVVHIAAGVDASIKGLTITGGNANGNGGGVYNQGGTLSLVDVGLSDNHSSAYGGGLINLGGSVTLERCTLSGNTANSSGGALYNGNVAASDMTVINSTIFGNSSLANGGALRNFGGQVNLIHATISGNNAVNGGGVSIGGGSFRIENSVIVGNTADGTAVDVTSNVAITVVGENFIGDNSTVSTWFPEGPFVGTSANPKDPLLLALADNGGPTDTMLPSIASPVLNAAITTPDLLIDQRGEPRLFGPQPDMGAVELQQLPPPPPPPNDGFSTPVVFSADGGSQQGTLLAASRDGASSADVSAFSDAADVWYRFVAPGNGTLRVDTCGSLALSYINTVLSVHSDDGGPGTLANELAANDQWQTNGDPTAGCPSSYDSSVALPLSEGDAVLIRVSVGDYAGGPEFVLNVSFEIDVEMDTDADGVGDSVDNCTLVANPGQLDTDGDGHGNLCDADLNNDCIANAVDLGVFRTLFFQPGNAGDLNGDGITNAIDLGIFRTLFFQPPGPSAVGACTL